MKKQEALEIIKTIRPTYVRKPAPRGIKGGCYGCHFTESRICHLINCAGSIFVLNESRAEEAINEHVFDKEDQKESRKQGRKRGSYKPTQSRETVHGICAQLEEGKTAKDIQRSFDQLNITVTTADIRAIRSRRAWKSVSSHYKF